jgi:hypothetical protein
MLGRQLGGGLDQLVQRGRDRLVPASHHMLVAQRPICDEV